MIFAHIDNIDDRNIIGFEVGTRALFDVRRGGDPLWVFLDYNAIKVNIVTAHFLSFPATYYLDDQNLLQTNDLGLLSGGGGSGGGSGGGGNGDPQGGNVA